MILAAVLFMPAVNTQNKALQKAQEKEYKNIMKEYKKGNWELFGSSRTLEVDLLKHYDQLNTLGENAFEQVGVASRLRSKSLGHRQAINDACISYAQRAGSTLNGRIISDMAGNGDDTSGEFDHFYAAYERAVEK